MQEVKLPQKVKRRGRPAGTCKMNVIGRTKSDRPKNNGKLVKPFCKKLPQEKDQSE